MKMKILQLLAVIQLWSLHGPTNFQWAKLLSLAHAQDLDSSNNPYIFSLDDDDEDKDERDDYGDNDEKSFPGFGRRANVECDPFDDLDLSEVEGHVLEAYDPITDDVSHHNYNVNRTNRLGDYDEDYFAIDQFMEKAAAEHGNTDFSRNFMDISHADVNFRGSNHSNYRLFGTACPEKCLCEGTKLDCAGQNLTSVPEGISPLTTWLDLSMNSLQRLPEDAFENMISLKELRCVGNNLTELPHRLFRRNRYLQLLNFQGNVFMTVPPKTFQNLSYLLELHLDANLISSIPREAFVGLTNLRQLWLDDNRLDNIPVTALNELTGLQALTLIKNQISEIPAFAFQNNTRLVQLRLANNQIKDIDDQAFSGLAKLKYLQLQNNKISTMPSALLHLVSLDELNLEDNRLTEIPDNSFLMKEKLTTLVLGSNPIAVVWDQAFNNLPSLQELKLSEVHDMTKFPDLKGTMNLTVLQLDRSHIKSIPRDVCSMLKKLKTFDVHSNKIGIIPDMSQCKHVTILNIANNELTSIDGQLFTGMDHLKDLTLGINYIQTIPEDAFTGLGALEYLNMAENQISDIHPRAFLPLKSLKDLNLAYNKIQHLPTAGLVSLEKLKVFNNPDLREFPPKQEFPKVNNFILTYAYHCCDFILSRPEQMYLDMIREHVVWMDAGEPGHMAMWARYENETKIWESLIENTTTENELWDSFARNDYDLSNHRLGPAAATYLEDYNSHAYDHNYVIAKAAISCKPKPGPFMPCDDLFGWWSLRCGVWFVFMLALLGNGVVFFVSVTSKSKMDVPRFLICNLALADFFMGIYLGILAIMDASTLGQFKKYAIQWQMSAGCLVAGTLGVLSSELSVFTLTVITLERFYAITHAMQLSKRLSLKHAGIIMLCGWLWSFLLAILPLFGISDYRKFAVCLPFAIETAISKTYVCFIMVFNGLSFFIILSCYLVMYLSIRNSQAWNSNDTRVAKRMALLVFTDFFCWAPIAFLSLAAAFGKNLIHLNEAKVLTIFILPLNSCANPFLYAFFTKQFKRDCVLLCRRLEDSSIARHFSQVSQRHVSISWKYQRRPSALHSLMGDNKSNNSHNNSSSSNSYGLINYISEINSRLNLAGKNEAALTSDQHVHAIRGGNGSCGGARGCRATHRHTHKYKPCPTGRKEDDDSGYIKTIYADVSNDDDVHVILHREFYSQSGTETNGCTVETYLNEDDNLFMLPSPNSCDDFATDQPICWDKDNMQRPKIVIHTDDNTTIDGDDYLFVLPSLKSGEDFNTDCSICWRKDRMNYPKIVIHTDDNRTIDGDDIWVRRPSYNSELDLFNGNITRQNDLESSREYHENKKTLKKYKDDDEQESNSGTESNENCLSDSYSLANCGLKGAQVVTNITGVGNQDVTNIPESGAQRVSNFGNVNVTNSQTINEDLKTCKVCNKKTIANGNC